MICIYFFMKCLNISNHEIMNKSSKWLIMASTCSRIYKSTRDNFLGLFSISLEFVFSSKATQTTYIKEQYGGPIKGTCDRSLYVSWFQCWKRHKFLKKDSYLLKIVAFQHFYDVEYFSKFWSFFPKMLVKSDCNFFRGRIQKLQFSDFWKSITDLTSRASRSLFGRCKF